MGGRDRRPDHLYQTSARRKDLLDERVDAVLSQARIQSSTKRVAGRLRRIEGFDERIRLPLPTSLPMSNALPLDGRPQQRKA